MVSYNKTLVVAFLTSLIHAAPTYHAPGIPQHAPDASDILADIEGIMGPAADSVTPDYPPQKRDDATSGLTGALGGASGGASGLTGALGGATGGSNPITGALGGATGGSNPVTGALGSATGGLGGASGASGAAGAVSSGLSGATGAVSGGASGASGATGAVSSGASNVSGATGSVSSGASSAGDAASGLTGLLSGLTGGASGSTGVLNAITGLFGGDAASGLGGADPLSCVVRTLVGDVQNPDVALQALQVVLATGINGYKKNGTFQDLEGMILSMDAANGGNGGFAPLALAQLGLAFGSTASDGQKGLEIFAKYLKTLIQVTQDDLNTLPAPGPSATNNYFYNKMTNQAQENGIILGFFQDETLEAADVLIKDYNWICVSANGILQSAESLVNCVGGLDSLAAADNTLKDFVGLWCPTNSDYIGEWGTGTATLTTSLQSAAV